MICYTFNYSLLFKYSVFLRQHTILKRRDQKEVQDNYEYELALVVNAKIEDEARLATLEAVKSLLLDLVVLIPMLMTGKEKISLG